MPIYGKAKERNMMRSVLPSTARKSARDNLNALRRRERSRVTAALAVYRGYVVDADELDHDESLNYFAPYYGWDGYHEVIYDRRAADKTAPLERWAAKKTEHLPKEDRLSWLRGILPDSTIGRHALQHVENTEAFNLDDLDHRGYWSPARVAERRRRWAEEREAMREQLRADLRWVIETHGMLRKFNAAYKTTWTWRSTTDAAGNRYSETVRVEGRPLRGLHDIDDFIDAHIGRGTTQYWVRTNLHTFAERVAAFRRKGRW